MDSRIKTVLEYAVMAPSGDNCQPWKFAVDGLQVDLYNNPDQDRSLYNLKQRASLIAHGALLENIRLAAPSTGLHSHIEMLPEPENVDLIARVCFTENETDLIDLFNEISRRHTNREKYLPVKILDTQAARWSKLSERTGERIWLACQKEQIDHLADLLSLNDRLVFGVPSLHQFLFEQLRWSDFETRETADGLDIRTLGLNAMDRFSFRLLKHWGVVATFSRFGLSDLIQLKAKQLIKSSSAIAVVTIPGGQSINYIEGGKLWQRLLLQLSREGLAAQPIAGLACLLQAAQEGLLEGMVNEQQMKLLLNTRNELMNYFGIEDPDVILAMFRIGHGPQVTRALRRPLSSFLLDGQKSI